MSSTTQFLLLLALDLGGLVAVYFLLRARIRRQLELESLLDGVREESRALVLELNETADRNVSLVEDRVVALRGLLDEVDRRMGVARRELESRDKERRAFEQLSRRRPIVPSAAEAIPLELAPRPAPEPPAPKPAVSKPALDIRVAPESVVPPRSKREEALDLHRRGFSAEIIAARIGATVSEIELLVDMEQRRAASTGDGIAFLTREPESRN